MKCVHYVRSCYLCAIYRYILTLSSDNVSIFYHMEIFWTSVFSVLRLIELIDQFILKWN